MFPPDEEEVLTPEQAAVYCAVHGFELWHDTNYDAKLPWGVARENWRHWHWATVLTTEALNVAMDTALADSASIPAPEFLDLLGHSILHIPIPPTPQPAKSLNR